MPFSLPLGSSDGGGRPRPRPRWFLAEVVLLRRTKKGVAVFAREYVMRRKFDFLFFTRGEKQALQKLILDKKKFISLSRQKETHTQHAREPTNARRKEKLRND